jgi:hypothetical protein
VAFSLLPWILDRDGKFHRVENTWKPIDLFTEQQSQKLMGDMIERYDNLSAAQGELARLDRAEMYLKMLRRMGFNVRRARFSRRTNHMTFAKAISDFYSDYGTVLRFLRYDQLQGKFNETAPQLTS